MNCPKCDSTQVVKNGHTHYGKQRFRCQECRRQFVENPTRQPVDESTRELIEKLLKEQLALAAIARVTGVSERWLREHPTFAKISNGKLTIEVSTTEL